MVLKVTHEGISFHHASGKVAQRRRCRRGANRTRPRIAPTTRCTIRVDRAPARAAPPLAPPRAVRAQAIQHIPYASIIKWVPSNLRSRDPGDPDCLDIQVETTAGRRDLRMRCAAEEAVDDIIRAIRSTVEVRARMCARM